MPEFIKNQCPVCDSSEFKAIGTPDLSNNAVERPDDTKIVKCCNCGTLYVNPMPIWVGDDLNKLYSSVEEYFPQTEEWVNKRATQIIEKRYHRITKYLKANNRNLLEVGAGIQAFMAKYLSKKGWNIVVQEPAKAFSDVIKRDNPSFHLETIDFLDMDTDKKYSLIYIDSVLEHVHNPIDYLKKCYELLEDGGLLYTVSPNENSFKNWVKSLVAKLKKKPCLYLCPYSDCFHLIGFSKKSAAILAEKSNMKLVYHHYGNDV